MLSGIASCRLGKREVAEFTTGGYFGELALLHGGIRTADVVAETDMELLVLDAREFRSMLMTTPGIGVKMLARLAERLADADAHYSQLTAASQSTPRAPLHQAQLLADLLQAAGGGSRDHVLGEAVGQRDPERERGLAAAAVERAHHELLVGLAAARHAGGDERRRHGLDGPQLDRLVRAGPARVGQAERVAGAGAVHAPHAVAVPVGHARHATHVGVVVRQVGEVEAVGPHGLGRDREDGGGNGGRRGRGVVIGHGASVCRGRARHRQATRVARPTLAA